MHEFFRIELPQSFTMTIPPMATIDAIEGIQKISACRANGMEVLSSALAIEGLIDQFLMFAFFGAHPEDKPEIRAFVLDSEWCTLSAKRRLLLQVVDTHKRLNGHERNECDKLLADVMRYRNAFAHGTITFDGDGSRLRLSYFSGVARSDTLDEAYWIQLQRTFQRAFHVVSQLVGSVATPRAQDAEKGNAPVADVKPQERP